MKEVRSEHKGSRIEIVARGGKHELRIDGARMRWGRMPSGMYVLRDYAYDPQPDLVKLAERYIEYRARKAEYRARKAGGK